MDILNKKEIDRVFDNLLEGVIIHNKDTSISYFNHSALKILKISKKDLLGKTAQDPQWYFIDENHEKIELQDYPVMKVLNSKETLTGMIMGIHHNDETIIWVQVNGVPIFNEEDEIDVVVISFVDITKQKETVQLLHNKTYYNNISNLPNMYSLNEYMLENKNSVALMFLEIDNFSNLTQYFANGSSKKIVTFVAEVLSKTIQEPNIVFHTKLNEFAILLYDKYTTKESIYFLLTSLNERELFFENYGINLQVTAGISFEENDRIVTAQASLSSAKHDKNTFYNFYSKEDNIGAVINNEIFWSQALRKVIEQNTLVPVFQQIVNNQTLEIAKYEVLMRLDIDGEIYAPFSFLDMSKKLRLYKYLTLTLIENVFHYFKNKDIPFSINLNTEDLMDEDINFILLRKVQEFHTPSNITIEVVESEGIENFTVVNRFLNRLKLYGAKIAIDDFGSGYSNFEYILKLDADYIKIDGSLIKDIDVNVDSQDIVKTIVSFAKKKNILTIAEFVSSKEIYDYIKSIGIDYSQGYYFGKPEMNIQNVNYVSFDQRVLSQTKVNHFKQLIYSSKLNTDLSPTHLKSMFLEAAKRNEKHDISGFIVFDDKYFLQIIEGDEDTINNLYENIVNDPRHTDIQLLGIQPIENRDFENWHLGYVEEDKVIKDFVYQRTNRKTFLPHQFDYKFALDFLKDIQKIV